MVTEATEYTAADAGGAGTEDTEEKETQKQSGERKTIINIDRVLRTRPPG